VGKGFEINKQAIRKMSREIEKEFAKNPSGFHWNRTRAA